MSTPNKQYPENRQKTPRHERHLKLAPEQREANVKRWPIRHAAQQLGDRILWALYGKTIAAMAPVETPNYQSVGSNVVKEAWRQQDEPSPNLNLLTADTDAQPYVLDVIQSEMQQPEQEAASDIDPAMDLDIEAIRQRVSREAV